MSSQSVNKCIGDLQKRTAAQNRALQDVQNEFVESLREQTHQLVVLALSSFFPFRAYFESAYLDELFPFGNNFSCNRELDAKIKRKSRDYSTAHFPIAANARTDEFSGQSWRIPRY